MKIIVSFLVSVSMWGQTVSKSSDNSPTVETSLSTSTTLLGYRFHEGGFMSARLSNTRQFHFGIVHTYVEDYKVLEIPFILKQQLTTDFHAFFGAKLNSTINADFGSTGMYDKPTFGGSLEMGFQYDLQPNIMIEMRYSIPNEQGKEVFPEQMFYNNGNLLRMGTKIGF